MLVSDLITQAFLDIDAIMVGESITTAEQADAFARLNQLVSSLSTEGAMVFNQVMQSFPLQNGITAYQLGSGGTFPTNGGLRAQKVTAWRAVLGDMVKGGPVLPMDEFGAAAAAANQSLAELAVRSALEGLTSNVNSPLVAPIPSVVGADTNYPLINVRVAPAPSNAGGQIELAYWTPIAAFGAVGDVINLPPGYELMLRSNLAVQLYPIYPRQGGIDPVLAATAQNSKQTLMQQHSMMRAQAAPAQ